MEFGALTPQGWRLDLKGVDGDAAKWETCRRVIEAMDHDRWDSLWVFDHFHTIPTKEIEATFEAWTMMAHMASATKHSRIGQLVTCNEYRNPAYLAKIAACVDVMSGGRLDFGIGCGWFGEEFGAYGYEYGTWGRRLRRLEESLQIFKAMWTQDSASFEGKHFSLKEAVNQPAPLQKPHPPIVIGGRGEKILLRLVAQYADVWNYNGNQDEYAHYRDVLKQHCLDVGRDFDEIRITSFSGGIAYDSDEEMAVYAERLAPQGRPMEAVLKGVSCKGSRDECTEFLLKWKELGVDGVIFCFNDIASYGAGDSQPEIFRRDIFPQLR